MTLRQRIATILAVLALAVGASAAFASYLDTAAQLRSTIDDTLIARASALVQPGDGDHPNGEHGGGHDGEFVGEGGCPSPGSFAPATAGQIVSPTGAVISCIEGAPVLPVAAADKALSGNDTRLVTTHVAGTRYRLLSRHWPAGGTLQVARSTTESEALLDRLRLRLAAVVAIATAVAALLGWAVATWVVAPILKLRDTAAHIATSLDLSTPVDVQASGEVGSLATSFAAMVTAVGRSREQQRRLVADAGHEMRTPLTSLRSNMELLGRIEQLPVADRQEVVADVLADIDELSALLTELVDLASDLAAAEPDETVYLGDLARAVAARTQRRGGRAVTVEDTDVVPVTVRPRQIERAIANLVDNAVKYTPPGTPIEIAVTGVEVTVRDRGPGVAEEDLPRIFDRFYRAVEMRTRPGSGLGLSIVEEIVHSHRGSVFARNRADGGLEVGFVLTGRALAPG
jgi:two-component system sensor histidine kinase MprB